MSYTNRSGGSCGGGGSCGSGGNSYCSGHDKPSDRYSPEVPLQARYEHETKSVGGSAKNERYDFADYVAKIFNLDRSAPQLEKEKEYRKRIASGIVTGASTTLAYFGKQFGDLKAEMASRTSFRGVQELNPALDYAVSAALASVALVAGYVTVRGTSGVKDDLKRIGGFYKKLIG